MVAYDVGAGHSATRALLTHLVSELRRAVFVENVIGVEVNRCFAHSSVIINVERMRHVRSRLLFELVVEVVVESPVGSHVGNETARHLGLQPRLCIVAEAHRVLVIEHVVHARRDVERAVVRVGIELFGHVPERVGHDIEGDKVALAVLVIVVPHATEYIETIVAVVQVQPEVEVGIVALAVVALHVAAPSLALLAAGLDEDDRPHLRVVLRPGGGDEFHALDALATDLVQFGLVAQLPPVDVDERCTLAEHLYAVALLLHAGQLLQHVVGCSRLAQ